jgi:DNA-binding CsgD family transcriptional regulator
MMSVAKEVSSLFEQALAAISAAEGQSDPVLVSVIAIREIYGLANVTYHLGQLPGAVVDGPYVKSTYPGEWLSRYLIKGYTRVDPVVLEGFARVLPFDWRELTLTPAAMELFQDFQAHGLEAQGYSVPIVDKLSRRALFSLNGRMEGDAWSEFIAAHGADFAEMAHRLHAMAMEEIFGKSELPRFARRELECLIWAAQGKSAKETARILNVSDATVRDYLVSARLKLRADNITGAIAKAVKLRLINI